MTPPRLKPEVKKAARLTVLFTEAEMEKLERVAAFYAQPKSVAAHDMIVRAMADDLQAVSDESLSKAEETQASWRERMGL